MIIRILIITLSLIISIDVNAQIRVYDPVSGENKDVDYLIDSGAVNFSQKEKANLTTKQKSQEALEQIIDKIERPDISDQKEEPEKGYIVAFIDVSSMNEDVIKVINRLNKLKDLEKTFYLKGVSNSFEFLTLGVKATDKLNVELKHDSGNKIAKKFRVSSYPSFVYINPFKERVKYSLSESGITAFLMYKGEMEARLQAQ